MWGNAPGQGKTAGAHSPAARRPTKLSEALHDDPSIDFTYTAEDFIAAQQLHARPTRTGWTLTALFVPVAMLALTWALGDVAAAGATLALFALGGVIGAVVVQLALIPWMARRNFARHPLAHLPIGLILQPAGLATQSPRGRTDLEWCDIVRWRANAQTTLIYLSPRLFMNVPERLVDAGFPMSDLRARLTANVGAPIR